MKSSFFTKKKRLVNGSILGEGVGEKRKDKRSSRCKEVGEKTKDKRSSRCNGSSNNMPVIEIMSRLPVKSLMRFKCVCKRWRSTIQKDPLLIDLHLSRSLKTRQYLLIISKHPRSDHPTQKHLEQAELKSYWTADLFALGSTINNIPMSENLVFDEILKPVSSLMCLIDRHMFAVRIYNVSTRKVVTPWIKSTLLEKLQEAHGIEVVSEHRDYQFGVEPMTKEYKVICVWSIVGTQTSPGGAYTIHHYKMCEILTLGNNSTWRKIDEVPPSSISGIPSIHVNGSIYWIGDHVLVSFKVGSEKFGVIPIPYFINHHRIDLEIFRQYHCFYEANVHELEVDGQLALSKRTGPHTVELWILDDDGNKAKGNKAADNQNWMKETITLPFSWKYDNIYFHAVVGTDQLISDCFNDYAERSFYLYSRKEKTFRYVQNSSGITQVSPYIIATFAESLLPVCW